MSFLNDVIKVFKFLTVQTIVIKKLITDICSLQAIKYYNYFILSYKNLSFSVSDGEINVMYCTVEP